MLFSMSVAFVPEKSDVRNVCCHRDPSYLRACGICLGGSSLACKQNLDDGAVFESCSLPSCCQSSPFTIDATRRRAFALVSQAYTSIIADDFAAFVGLPVEEAVKGTWSLLVTIGEQKSYKP